MTLWLHFVIFETFQQKNENVYKTFGKERRYLKCFYKISVSQRWTVIPDYSISVSILQKLHITEYPILHTRAAKRRDWISGSGLLESNGWEYFSFKCYIATVHVAVHLICIMWSGLAFHCLIVSFIDTVHHLSTQYC